MELSPNIEPKNKIVKLPSEKDNFGLTISEFQISVENMRNGSDGFLLNSLAKQLPESMIFLQNKFRMSRSESYDACMETFLQFREKVLAGKIKYGNLRYLYTRMCVNTVLDSKRNSDKITTAVEQFQSSIGLDAADSELFFEQLDTVISQLTTDQRKLVNEIYFSDDKLEKIAEKLEISYSNLRKKKQRLLNLIKNKIQINLKQLNNNKHFSNDK